jgi:hypothetical protein
MTLPATPAAPVPVQPVTHGCQRCGAPVAIDVGLCERCNPLGLADSSSSQLHGTVFIGVVLAVVALALIGRLSLTGVGPFEGSVAAAVASGDGLAITLTVTNNGTGTGQTTCRVTDPVDRSGGGSAFLLSPQIAGGKTSTFTQTVTQLGSKIRPLTVECSAP